MQPTALVNIDPSHSAVDQLYPVLQVALPHLAIKREAVYLKGEQRRHCRCFVDDISTIIGTVDVELEIIGEAVLRIVLFNEVSAKSKFQKKINSEFDEGFADDWTVFVRALNHGYLEIWGAHLQVGGRKLAGCFDCHHYNLG